MGTLKENYQLKVWFINKISHVLETYQDYEIVSVCNNYVDHYNDCVIDWVHDEPLDIKDEIMDINIEDDEHKVMIETVTREIIDIVSSPYIKPETKIPMLRRKVYRFNILEVTMEWK